MKILEGDIQFNNICAPKIDLHRDKTIERERVEKMVLKNSQNSIERVVYLLSQANDKYDLLYQKY